MGLKQQHIGYTHMHRFLCIVHFHSQSVECDSNCRPLDIINPKPNGEGEGLGEKLGEYGPIVTACNYCTRHDDLCVFSKLDRMESKLNEKVTKLQGCQEKRLQLEENIQRLQPQLRDMKNTMEKYTNSMTVQQIDPFF